MKFMYNELYNAANQKHAGGKWETINQLGVALCCYQYVIVGSSILMCSLCVDDNFLSLLGFLCLSLNASVLVAFLSLDVK